MHILICSSALLLDLCYRLLLGLTKRGRRIKIIVLGTTWGYEEAMLFKSDECFLEAGPQVILGTFIQMSQGWKLYEHVLIKALPKAYYVQGDGPEGSDPEGRMNLNHSGF